MGCLESLDGRNDRNERRSELPRIFSPPETVAIFFASSADFSGRSSSCSTLVSVAARQGNECVGPN